MKVKYVATFAIASIMSLGLVSGCKNPCAAQPDATGGTEEVNPCAGAAEKANPCASKPSSDAGN